MRAVPMFTILRRVILPTALALAAGAVLSQTASSPMSIQLSLQPPDKTRHLLDTELTMEMDFQPRPPNSTGMFPLTTLTRLEQQIEWLKEAESDQRMLRLSTRYREMSMRAANGMTRSMAGSSLPPPLAVQARQVGGRFDQWKAEGAQSLGAPAHFIETLTRSIFEGLATLNNVPFAVGETKELPFIMDYPMPMSFGRTDAGLLLANYTLVAVKDGIADFDIDILVKQSISTPKTANGMLGEAPAGSRPSAQIEANGTGKLRIRLNDGLRLHSLLSMEMNLSGAASEAPGGTMSSRIKMRSVSTGRSAVD